MSLGAWELHEQFWYQAAATVPLLAVSGRCLQGAYIATAGTPGGGGVGGATAAAAAAGTDYAVEEVGRMIISQCDILEAPRSLVAWNQAC